MTGKIIHYKYKFIYFAAIVTSRLPFRLLRILVYRLFFRYKISFKAKLKFGTVIAVDSATIGNCELGVFNCFRGPCSISIGDGTILGKGNEFRCPEWVLDTERQKLGYKRYLTIGDNCVFGHKHFFDLAGGLSIGHRNWFGGRYSQIWTHGIGVLDREVSIGDDNYIGSAVRFTPGSSISNKSVIAVGSVIGRKFEKDNLMLGTAMARVIQAEFDWLEEKKKSESVS